MSEDLRVVVVTYAPGPTLDSFVESLATATTRPYELVVSDNGPPDEAVRRAAAVATVLPSGRNLGYGGGINRGAAGFEGDWLVACNPDVRWRPGALDELLAAADRWPEGAVFGPAVVTPAGELYPSARSFPSLSRGIGHALLGWWWPTNRFTQSYRRERAAPVEATAGWLSGSCMLLRRKAYEQVGGFDEGYFMYFEDLDLCRRLAEAGWSSVYVPGAVVSHVGGAATRHAKPAMLRAHHRSAYRYLARQYAGPRWLPVRAVLALGLALRYLLARVLAPVREGARPTRSASVLKGD